MSLLPEHPSVTGPADPEHAPAASYALAPMLGMKGETYARVMTANLRLLKKLGRA